MPSQISYAEGMMNPPPLNEELQRLQAHLSQRDDVMLAIAFGSVASGQARFDSDLDLAIDLGRELTADDKLALISDLATLTGRPIDLVDLRTVGVPLLGQILAHGKRLVGSNSSYAQLMSRNLFDTADFLPLRNRILKERRERWMQRQRALRHGQPKLK